MNIPISAHTLAVPRNKTALMQYLQLLVGREQHRTWCGGIIAKDKFSAFLTKMGRRYPITRNARQRSYDRKRGRAVVHLVVFPTDTKVLWWLVSSEGVGGLCDEKMEDAKIAKNAMTAEGHITFGDYVLLYATKRDVREIQAKGNKTIKVSKNMSTWTWKIRGEVMKEIRSGLHESYKLGQIGMDSPNGNGWGLRGLFGNLVRRPLFSGIRTQVFQLHKDALALMQTAKLSAFSSASPIPQPISLPKMRRIKIFGTPPLVAGDLCQPKD